MSDENDPKPAPKSDEVTAAHIVLLLQITIGILVLWKLCTL